MKNKPPKRKVHLMEIFSKPEPEKCGFRILDQQQQDLMLFKKDGWLLVYSQDVPAIITVKDQNGQPGAEQDSDCPSEGGVSKKINKNLRPVRFKITARLMVNHDISIQCCDKNGENCSELMMGSGPVMRVEN